MRVPDIKTVLLALAVLFVGLWLGWEARGFIEFDGCLDRGGRWNKVRNFCEGDG